MTGVPVETVVEMLILNVNYRDDDNCVDVCLSTDPLLILKAERKSELRVKVREYVETLVRTGDQNDSDN